MVEKKVTYRFKEIIKLSHELRLFLFGDDSLKLGFWGLGLKKGDLCFRFRVMIREVAGLTVVAECRW
jgi:hypothetical protein